MDAGGQQPPLVQLQSRANRPLDEPSISSHSSPHGTTHSVSVCYELAGVPYPSPKKPYSDSVRMPTQVDGAGPAYKYPKPRAGMPSTRPTTAATATPSSRNRASRHRRKDPSCDGCRKRKVKCDATLVSNCSECSRNGVNCQFTKVSNRRMLPLKHIQDLERQLALAKQQINQMESTIQHNGSTDLGKNTTNIPIWNVLEPVSRRFTSPPTVKSSIADFSHGFYSHGRGCSKTSILEHQNGALARCPYDDIPLPPKHVTDKLLSQYHEFSHVYAPPIHWPTFQRESEELYRVGTFKGMAKVWIAIFFAVLACGTLLNRPDSAVSPGVEGQGYVQLGMKSIDLTHIDPTLDHVRASLLFSIYHVEVNVRSVGMFWLAAAVSIAQDLELDSDRGSCRPFDPEMRERVWWAVYTWDRAVSLEMDKLLLINDEDCGVAEPSETYMQQSYTAVQPAFPTAGNAMIAIIPVARLISMIKKVLRFRTISTTILENYDEHFKAIMASYPDPFSIHSTADLDPRLLPAACTLQAARFLLYRHNLTPICRPSERCNTLDRLVSVAQDTALYVQQSFKLANTSSSAARFRIIAPVFYCTHIWRCLLVLCFRARYAEALTLLQVSAAVSNLQQTNTAYGRYLSFFLDKLVERLHTGATKEQLENDEEMLAYVSGDMQSTSDNAWVWTGSKTQSTSPIGGSEAEPAASHQCLNDKLDDWSGWGHIHHVIKELLHKSEHPSPSVSDMALISPSLPVYVSLPLSLSSREVQQQNGKHLAPATLPQNENVNWVLRGEYSWSMNEHIGGSGGGCGGDGSGGDVRVGFGSGGFKRISIQDIV